MPKQIFDQCRPRSTMAQQLEEAFAGCDEWTVVRRPQRHGDAGLSPRAASSPHLDDGIASLRFDEPDAL